MQNKVDQELQAKYWEDTGTNYSRRKKNTETNASTFPATYVYTIQASIVVY